MAINPSGNTLLLGSTGLQLDDVACLQQSEDAGQEHEGQRYFEHVRREIDDIRQLDTSTRGPGPVPVAVLNTKVLQLPASMAGRCSLLHFEGSDYFVMAVDPSVGAGGHEGFFGPFQLDISPFVQHGDRNVVRLTVTSPNDPRAPASPSPRMERLPPGCRLPEPQYEGADAHRTERHDAGTLRNRLFALEWGP